MTVPRRRRDTLGYLLGSRTRADILAILLASGPRRWRPSGLGRATSRSSQVVNRELRRLTAAGLVRATGPNGAREYEARTDDPLVRDLARFVGQTRGRVPRLRHALEALRAPVLAFAVGRPLGHAASAASAERRQELDLIVLANVPKALIRVQLAGVDADVVVHAMTIREWLTRLRKGDVFLRRARRSRKLWVLGGWGELVARERAQLESRRMLEAAISDWREELSDEWDEAWDPFSEVARDAR